MRFYRVPDPIVKYAAARSTLDVGGGWRTDLHLYSLNYTLLDNNEQYIAGADKQGLGTIKGDVAKRWNTSKKYDLVWMSHVIEHLDQKGVRNAMNEANRCLEHNGRIMIVTPSTAAWFFYSEWTHVRPYDWQSLKNMLEENGFEDVEWGYIHMDWLPKWLQRIICKFPVGKIASEVYATGLK